MREVEIGLPTVEDRSTTGGEVEVECDQGQGGGDRARERGNCWVRPGRRVADDFCDEGTCYVDGMTHIYRDQAWDKTQVMTSGVTADGSGKENSREENQPRAAAVSAAGNGGMQQ
uniref:Uncharacterized protein n=1 Tax=Oryza brachyantha TaxID=4533 RepID=J3N8C2_ORYBR